MRSFVAVSLRDLSKPEISKTITSPFLSGATDFSLDDKGGKVLIVSSKTSSIVLVCRACGYRRALLVFAFHANYLLFV